MDRLSIETYNNAKSGNGNANANGNSGAGVNASSVKNFYLYDGRGSVSELTGMTGTVTVKYRYDDFGKLKEIQKFNTAEENGKDNGSILDVLGDLFGISSSKDQDQNQNQNPGYHEFYAYNAESYNPNTEMQYLRARYYKPETANFLTEDSYLGDILKPLTLNRYNYCAGNPVNYKDPSGNVILEAFLIGAVVGAVAGAAIEVYKGVKEYQNQDPQDKKDLSTFLKTYDYASAGLNVAYGAFSGAVTGVGAAVIGAAAGATLGAVAGGAMGGGVHELLTSTTEVVKEKAKAKEEGEDAEFKLGDALHIAGRTIGGAVLGGVGGYAFSNCMNAMAPMLVKNGVKYFAAGAYSGVVAAGLGTMMQGAPLDSADLIFAGLLGGSAAYAGYKMADVVTRNNARTTVEDANAKIKATEDPVKENTGNTSSKNSNQNNGGSKNSGKNNANTENNSTAKNNNATKNNAKNSQTPLEENANAARNGAETDTCPLSKGSTETVNVGKRDLVELRSRLGVPETDTIAVGKTNVKGLEDLTFEGQSPKVRNEAGLPDVDEIWAGRNIKSPSKNPLFTRHAEEVLANDFDRAVMEKLGSIHRMFQAF